MEILARDRKYQKCPFSCTGFLSYTIKKELFPLGVKWSECIKIIDRLLSRSKKPNAPFLHVE